MKRTMGRYILAFIIIFMFTNIVNAKENYKLTSISTTKNDFKIYNKETKGKKPICKGVSYGSIEKIFEILNRSIEANVSNIIVSLEDLNKKKSKKMLIKSHLESILKDNNNSEILYGEYLGNNEFIYLIKNYKGERLYLETIRIKNNKVDVISDRKYNDIKEINNSAEIGVIELESNGSKAFFIRPILDMTISVSAYVFNDNKIEKKSYMNNFNFVKESDEIYKFLQPNKFNGSSRSIFDKESNTNYVNKTLLDIMDIEKKIESININTVNEIIEGKN